MYVRWVLREGHQGKSTYKLIVRPHFPLVLVCLWVGCSILVGPGIRGQVLGEMCLVVCRLSLSMSVVGLPMEMVHFITVLSSWL